MYATAALAEQNSLNSAISYNSFGVANNNQHSILKQIPTSMHQQKMHQQQQQHLHQHHSLHQLQQQPAVVVPLPQQHLFPTSQNQTFLTNYSTMIPHSKYNHIPKVSKNKIILS